MSDITTVPLQGGQRPPAFALASTASQTIELDTYRDKVRVALVFLGANERPDSVVAALDAAHIGFGERRTQLLVVSVGPISVAKGLLAEGGRVPVLADGDGSVTKAYSAMGDADDVHSFLVDEFGLLTSVIVSEHDRPVADLLDALDQSEARRPFHRVDNSPRVVDERTGQEVDVERWDPMPDALRTLDGMKECDLPGHPMEGESPTG